jgi:hypothetical protein
MIGFFSSCEDEESKGDPIIKYVRVTNPDQADSLLVEATMGKLIVLVGENLDNVNEVFFNDQKAMLDPAYITSTSLMVVVPNLPPKEVTNIITLNTRDGRSVIYNFAVKIPAPEISSAKCEYAAAGDTFIIYGDYFFDPKVFFPGDVEGQVLASTQTALMVKVPADAQKGKIKVKTNFGSVNSNFYFRDDRNIILDFDNLNAAGSWQPGKTGNSNPTPISGNYARFNGSLDGTTGQWPSESDFGLYLWGEKNGRANVPFYSGDIKKAVLKFEFNVLTDWKAKAFQIVFTPWGYKDKNDFIYDAAHAYPRALYAPWWTTDTKSFKTDGWITVTIPLTEFIYNFDGTVCPVQLDQSLMGSINFIFYNGGKEGAACSVHACMDNVRIVPL